MVVAVVVVGSKRVCRLDCRVQMQIDGCRSRWVQRQRGCRCRWVQMKMGADGVVVAVVVVW